MRKKSFVICGLIFIAGVFGAFFRWLQNTTAFEEETSLSIPGATWSVIVLIYLIACAVAIFLAVQYLVSRKKLTTGMEFPDAFAGNPLVCGIVAIAALILTGAGGILTAVSALRGGVSLFELIDGVFAVIAALFVFIILRRVNSPRKKSNGTAFVIVVLFLCFRLIAEYKVSAADPVIWHYGIRILAISTLTLAYYYLAGYCFSSPKPKRTLYFSMLGIFLSIVTLADSVSAGYHFITAGLTLALITLMLQLTGNMVPAPKKRMTGSEE